MAYKVVPPGYPLYAFMPEWMIVAFVLISWSLWYAMWEKYNG